MGSNRVDHQSLAFDKVENQVFVHSDSSSGLTVSVTCRLEVVESGLERKLIRRPKKKVRASKEWARPTKTD